MSKSPALSKYYARKNLTQQAGQTFPITLSEKRGQTFDDTTYFFFIMWIITTYNYY